MAWDESFFALVVQSMAGLDKEQAKQLGKLLPQPEMGIRVQRVIEELTSMIDIANGAVTAVTQPSSHLVRTPAVAISSISGWMGNFKDYGTWCIQMLNGEIAIDEEDD